MASSMSHPPPSQPSQSTDEKERSLSRALKLLLSLLPHTSSSSSSHTTNPSSATLTADPRLRRQVFTIRSYEVGANKTATVETIMSLLQESAVNHMFMTGGFSGNGIWTSPSMISHNVTWVIAYLDLEVDKYPTWMDTVEIETWTRSMGDRLGMHGDWIIRDPQTGQRLARATSTWLMIDITKRKFSRVPAQVWDEISPFFYEEAVAFDGSESSQDIDELSNCKQEAEHVRSQLKAHYNDLDMNQHVNNSRYIRWILEAVPPSILKTGQLRRMTLEFKRECHEADRVKSLCHPKGAISPGKASIHCLHMLLRETDGSEILRGQTTWTRLTSAL